MSDNANKSPVIITGIEANFVYKFLKDITFYLKKRPDDHYEAKFTMILTKDEREILLKFLDYHKLNRYGM